MLALLAALACHPDPATDDTPKDSGTDPTGTDPTGTDPDTVPLAGECPMEEAFGGFYVQSDEGGTIVTGAMTDGVVPLSILEEVGADGDCVLLRRNNPYCDPACSSDETCDFDGTCIPYPTQQDVGTVTIDGLYDAVSMEPTQPGASYYDVDLPDPAYDPGALLTLRATGGVMDPFVLYGVGVEPLVLASEDWFVQPGSDFVVQWNAPSTAVRSTVHLRIDIDQHGATPVVLDCAFADTGTGTVPASAIDALTSFGVSGYPNGSIERRTVDSTDAGGGCVDLEVTSQVTPATVDLDGYTPCWEDTDCPDGQTCDQRMEICE